MSSLSTMTVGQLSELSNAPVVHPTGPRKSKLTAIARMASVVALKEALAEAGLKKKAERKAKKPASAKKSAAQVKRKNFTFRRLVYHGESRDNAARGKNGSFLRVAINKETRKVSKVNEKNWTERGDKLYELLYHHDTDYKSKPQPSPSKLTPVQKLARKAGRAFNREMARRAKAEEEWAAKYGQSFENFKNYLEGARTDVDDDEDEILGDGFVC